MNLSPGVFRLRPGALIVDKVRERRERVARCWGVIRDLLVSYDRGTSDDRANVLAIFDEIKGRRHPAPWLALFIAEMRRRLS